MHEVERRRGFVVEGAAVVSEANDVALTAAYRRHGDMGRRLSIC